MTDRISIVAEPRTVTGKKVKQLRRDGYVPGILYGRSEPMNVQMKVKELRRALRIAGSSQLIDLGISGETHAVLARDIQQHLTRRDIIHVDFLEVDLKQTIKFVANMVTVGTAPVEEVGEGRAALMFHEVEIEALPDDLVSELEIDISSLKDVNDVLLVSDIVLPKGVSIGLEPDTVVVRFQADRLELEEEVDELLEEGEEGEIIQGGEEGAEEESF